MDYGIPFVNFSLQPPLKIPFCNSVQDILKVPFKYSTLLFSLPFSLPEIVKYLPFHKLNLRPEKGTLLLRSLPVLSTMGVPPLPGAEVH